MHHSTKFSCPHSICAPPLLSDITILWRVDLPTFQQIWLSPSRSQWPGANICSSNPQGTCKFHFENWWTCGQRTTDVNLPFSEQTLSILSCLMTVWWLYSAHIQINGSHYTDSLVQSAYKKRVQRLQSSALTRKRKWNYENWTVNMTTNDLRANL
jgi:hypothetical protein